MSGNINEVRRGGKEPEGPEKKKKPDSDSFKEMMKVGKVRETDPEEQKRKKSQAESEEDLKAQQTSAPSQGLGEEGPPSIYETEGGSKPSMSSEPSTSLSPSAPTETSGVVPETGEGQTDVSTTRARKKKSEATQAPSPVTKKEAPEKGEGKPKTEAVSSEQVQQKKAEPIQKEKVEKTQEEMAAQAAPPPPTLPEGSWEKTAHIDEEEEKKIQAVEKGEEAMVAPQLDQGQAPGAITPTPQGEGPAPLSSPFANLPQEVQRLYEKMAGVMLVMHTSGVSETTINLDAPQFKNSVFYGTQVVITEYSTAPKEFNIELLGTEKAVQLMSGQTDQLVATFNGSGYNFKVHRIDTGYLAERSTEKKKSAKKVQRKKGA